MARLLVCAAHKSSGKTTVSLGLAAALARRGLVVQPFKKGPDYIDPMWLARASGRACYNLDPWLMESEEIRALFARHAAGADLALVEGNKGLHDGVSLDGSDSNAALARLIDLPVVLVVDTRGMTRGVAPLVLGNRAFDPQVRIAGVILNRVGGTRHEGKLVAVLERYTDIPVLGAVHEDPRLAIAERHLGLVPGNEATEADARVAAIAALVAAQVDLDRVLEAAHDAAPGARVRASGRAGGVAGAPIRVGVAMDRAFGFYYPDDLEAMAAAGAEIVPFDTLRDARLPEVDALFLGGGFPEVLAAELEANAPMRAQVREAVESGMPVHAECGGLMYLARSIEWHGRRYAMAGALPGEVVMHERPVGRGYVVLVETAEHPWPRGRRAEDPPDARRAQRSSDRANSPLAQGARGAVSAAVRAHEFHHSSLEGLPADVRFAYRVTRGHGVDGAHDGIVWRNTLATYAHLRSVRADDWAARFVAFARACRARAAGGALVEETQ